MPQDVGSNYMENWKTIDGYGGKYEVSDEGRIRSRKYGNARILKQGVTSKGRSYINLCVNGKYKSVMVHRLVAFYFVEGDTSLTVNHKDGDKYNNFAHNLEWITSAENTEHFVKNFVHRFSGENNGRSKLTQEDVNNIRSLYSTGEVSYADLAIRFGVSKSTVGSVVKKKNWNRPTVA